MLKNHTIAIGAAILIIQGCGVKTDPVPPVRPAEIGVGRPVYKSKKIEEYEIKNEKNKKTQKQNSEDEEE